MRLSIIDRLFGRDEDYEAYEEPRQPPIVPRAAPLREPEPEPVAPAPPTTERPFVEEAGTPAPARPPAPEPEPPSAVRQIGQWAGREATALLNDIPSPTREMVAEALVTWHRAKTQLDRAAAGASKVDAEIREAIEKELADPEFADDSLFFRRSSDGVLSALRGLGMLNDARVREWVITAVQGVRSFGPAKVQALFAAAGCGPMNVADLEPRLRSMEPGLRAWAAEALGQMDDPAAVSGLLGLLRDPDAGVRATAVSALGRHRDPAMLSHLAGVVRRDPDWSVRLAAVEAARAVDGYEAIGFLHELLCDRGWWRELQVLDNVERADARAGGFERILSATVDSLLAKIQAALPHSEPTARGWLMEVLGDTGDPRAVPILSSALQDAELEVRIRAIKGLGRIGGPSIVELIVPSLKDQQAQVRIAAAQALGDANDFRAVEPLLEAMKDPDQNVRGAVAVAVSRVVNTKALKPLLAALNDPDKEVRDQTASAMRRMADPTTINVVLGLLEGNKRQ